MVGDHVRGLRAEVTVRREKFLLDVSVSIPPSTTAALLGPNGAGKSTLVAALAGLLPIESGCIELDGVVLDDPAAGVFVPPDRRDVGVVFQDYLLFPTLDVAENVAFGVRSRGASRSEARRTAREWLARLGLGPLAKVLPAALSGGQAQRVALARALATEPTLLLLDEPTAALDVTVRTGLRRRLPQHLANYAGPRLLITHDPAEAFLLADQIHIIENGVITQVGDADDIRLRPRTPYIAELAGANLLVGAAGGGRVVFDDHTLRIADSSIEGPVLVTIQPTAISLHRAHPEGSPRNSWRTSVEVVERLGDRMRLKTGAPLELTVEVTSSAVSELQITEGSEVWVAVKATEIGVEPNQPLTQEMN